MFSPADLIVAPATPSGPGLRGIVRLAGEGLAELVHQLVAIQPPGLAAPGNPPRLVRGRLAGGLADEWGGLEVEILHWPGPGGPLGGPLAELQLPASVPLVAAVVASACGAGGRLARGGEFTLRGFLAGRLDLVQAEAVLSVVEARSPDELARGLDRLAGGAGGSLNCKRDRLLDLVADVEAAIDFADETTPDSVPVTAQWTAVAARVFECDAALESVAAGLLDRDATGADRPRVVLVGPPNIGKSSLLNALVGCDAALVADERGTTRDWLEARLGNEDASCVLVDLPGIVESGDGPTAAVDAAAADQARREIAHAAVIVVCRDAVADSGIHVTTNAARIDVLTRCDRRPVGSLAGTEYETSADTGTGIVELRQRILDTVACLPLGGSAAAVRLAIGVQSARAELAAVTAAVAASIVDEAVIAGHLRRAAEALAEVTGASVGLELLDRIFSRHCIGK